MTDFFGGLFQPLSAGEREIARMALLSADYCAACAHRRQHHDGGLGSCRYDGCSCAGWFDSQSIGGGER